ncbi:hypothetical protein RMCBS344292_14003 [Rhizopus microsporus]|nr:hypothetical protein RMCBS344292_14003 [Rhizopus microsporus]
MTIVILPLLLLLLRKFNGFYYRSIMTVVSLTIMATYGMIAALIFPVFGYTQYINFTVARGHYYITKFFCGIKVVPEGLEHLEEKSPVIFVCNHQSSMDIMLFGAFYPKNTSIVAKKEIKYYPFLGWYMRLSNAIFLDRKNRENAIKEARKASEDIRRKGVNVWVFPEGTRGHESEVTLLPFKKGPFYMAVQANVPIVPVVIANYSHLYNAKEKRFLSGVVRAKILPPISTDGIKQESADIEKLATECRRQMLEVLKEITPSETMKKKQ